MLGRFLYIMLILSLSPHLLGQTVIAFQGFEGTSSDNWGYTPPTQNTTQPIISVGVANYGTGYAASGTRSMRFGGGSFCGNTVTGSCINGETIGADCNSHPNGQELVFSDVDVSCYSSVRLSAAYRTHVICDAGSGEGFDGTDYIYFETRTNGGAWVTQATIRGASDCVWTYATASVACGSNPSVANPYTFNVPAGTTTFAFRIRLQRNRGNEVLYVDNVSLTGTGVSLAPVLIQHINP